MKRIQIMSLFFLALTSCRNYGTSYDASGTFESVETIISAEANGTIKEFSIEEGQLLKSGEMIGYIDTVQLFLKKRQTEAQIAASGKKIPDIVVQTQQFKQQAAVTRTRLDYLLNEQKRIQNLVKADAATAKQLDDITAQIKEVREQLLVISKQDAAQSSVLQTQASGIKGDMQPLYIQIAQIQDQLNKSKIINPLNGTVLVKYVQVNEMAVIGKPLYKIADLSVMTLRAYITGSQLPEIRIGQKVKVFTDAADNKQKETTGVVEWVSSRAEFTPKTIQTKDERANLVYAVKIKVVNDGSLKIGMYGEIKL